MVRTVRQRGATIVELSFALAILVLTLVPALGSIEATVNTQRHLATRDLLEERVRRAAVQVFFELKSAGRTTLQEVLDAPQTSTSIAYRRQEDFKAETGPVWSAPRRIHFSDRLLRLQSGGQERILGLNLDDVTFSLDGRQLRVNIGAEGVDSRGDRIHATRSIHVTLQN